MVGQVDGVTLGEEEKCPSRAAVRGLQPILLVSSEVQLSLRKTFTYRSCLGTTMEKDERVRLGGLQWGELFDVDLADHVL